MHDYKYSHMGYLYYTSYDIIIGYIIIIFIYIYIYIYIYIL